MILNAIECQLRIIRLSNLYTSLFTKSLFFHLNLTTFKINMVSKMKKSESSSSSDDEYEMSDLEEKDGKRLKKPVIAEVKSETKTVVVTPKPFFTKDNSGIQKRLIVVLDNL